MEFSFSNSSTGDNPVAGITRLIRKICLRREQEDFEEAARLEQNEFATALRDLRLTHGSDFLPDSELLAIFQAEAKRVTDALVLSELLVPPLVRALSNPPMALSQSRPGSAGMVGRDSSVPFARAAVAGTAPMIADMLDAMLAAERPGRRP